MNISLLVALRNNLEYNKHFYKTTRAIYPEVEICFSSYASTDGTHEWLDSLNDPFTKVFHTEEQGTFSDNFNKATSLATKDYVAYLHNDVVLAPGFLENLEKHVGSNTVVSYTTIEPPIFADHERPGKIIKDFGTELDTFKLQDFYSFVSEKQIEYKDRLEEGITFFMCSPRNTNLGIGGLDNLFNPCFCEDDDLIRRFKLLGMNLITSLDAICYHFVSKTSRFSEEYKTRTQEIEMRSNRNFLRKWGSKNHLVKYNIGIIIDDTIVNTLMLDMIEPWCTTLYVEDKDIVTEYILREQPNTLFDLSDRVKSGAKPDNDILVYINTKTFNDRDSNIIGQLQEIISESGEEGQFQLENMRLEIKAIKPINTSIKPLFSTI
jgi:GT2 family glycosyltransferase